MNRAGLGSALISDAHATAILDALPVSIALIDAKGAIVSTNESWRTFAGADVPYRPGYDVGVDFLEHCDGARGGDAENGHAIAEGIRAVLQGRLGGYTIEFAADSSPSARWLRLNVTPLGDGAVLMHTGIAVPDRFEHELDHLRLATRRMTGAIHQAEQKRGEEALMRFGAAMDASVDAIYLTDRASMLFVHVNDAACRMLGKTRAEVMAMGPWTLGASSRKELEDIYDGIIAGDAHTKPVELPRRRDDGSQVWIELRRSAQQTGQRWTIVTLVRDVTERREAEARIMRLNRVYAVLSGTNSLIVRVNDRQVLFTEACQIAIGHGRFKLAWIGLVDRSAAVIVPIAFAGVKPQSLGGFESAPATGAHISLLGDSTAARAVREKQPMVCNEITGDTTVVLQKERLEHRINSMAVLPLLLAGEAVGVFALYADEYDFFDNQEMTLLEELAGNIAFAMDHLAKAAKLSYLAYYDSLTGLANRALFHQRLEQGILHANENHRRVALVLLDVERFKTVNDTLGWEAGDELLKELAARLTVHAPDVERMARIDADHFAIMVFDPQSEQELAARIGQRIAEIFGPPFLIGGSALRVSAKSGVAMYPDDATDAETLFKSTEAALKIAKGSGERLIFYTYTMNVRIADSLALEHQLQHALNVGEFVLHYQPKISFETGLLTGVEALIRWDHPQRGLVPPGEFIPILEETGLILEVGRWVLGQAVEDHRRWRAAGYDPVRIAVNVSPLQLRNRSFIAEIQEALGRGSAAAAAAAAAGLELEITEGVIMANVMHSIANLQIIRAMGVTVAIDDFGTGFSSLSYLSKLPVDTLKIDRSFVNDMTIGPVGLALVSTIISLAHSLKLKVVAEGVETQEQSSLLRLLKCDEMQGYLISKPMPAQVFEAKYLSRQTLPARSLAR